MTVHHPTIDCDFDALDMQQHVSFQRLALEELVAHHLAVLAVKNTIKKIPASLYLSVLNETVRANATHSLPFT